jgi:hypothetical protein
MNIAVMPTDVTGSSRKKRNRGQDWPEWPLAADQYVLADVTRERTSSVAASFRFRRRTEGKGRKEVDSLVIAADGMQEKYLVGKIYYHVLVWREV